MVIEVEKMFMRRFQTQIVNVDFHHVTLTTSGSARHSPSECHSLFVVPLSHFCVSFSLHSLPSTSLVDERRFFFLFFW
jgi:hypothetical protein